MNTNKTLGSNKQHSDRECLYKAEVTMTGKGTRFQEWMPVFFTVNILALLMPGYLQKSSITMTERVKSGCPKRYFQPRMPSSGLCPDFISLSTILNNQIHRFHRTMNPDDFDKLNIRR